MTSSTATRAETTRVFRIFIKATPATVWRAITDPDWNDKYGYGCRSNYDLGPGGSYQVFPTPEMSAFGAPEVIIEGEVLESDPPHRLVQTWRALFDEGSAAEPATRLTWELRAEGDGDVTRLTVTHELEAAPHSLVLVTGEHENAGGGWPWILSDLKTFLESGASLAGRS